MVMAALIAFDIQLFIKNKALHDVETFDTYNRIETPWTSFILKSPQILNLFKIC
jgi:hypothetical protein